MVYETFGEKYISGRVTACRLNPLQGAAMPSQAKQRHRRHRVALLSWAVAPWIRQGRPTAAGTGSAFFDLNVAVALDAFVVDDDIAAPTYGW